jgi:GTP cyclohydrolase II
VTKAQDKLQHIVDRERQHDCDGVGKDDVCVRAVAVADLPTRFGPFNIVGFWNNRDEKEHVALVRGDVVGQRDVPTRLHSECFTGDVAGSLRCDCRDQLEHALRRIAEGPCGILLYMRQEGRGIGLINKLRAYSLQERGLDTVDANVALGFLPDERDYAAAAHMLHSLEVRSIRLITNNPDKVRQLEGYGVTVSDRIAHVIPPNEYNRFYLETKAKRSGHFIDFQGHEHVPEQADPVVVEGMGEPAVTRKRPPARRAGRRRRAGTKAARRRR